MIQGTAFLDENENTIEDGVYLLFRDPDVTWQNAPSDRHNQGMNLLSQTAIVNIGGGAIRNKCQAWAKAS